MEAARAGVFALTQRLNPFAGVRPAMAFQVSGVTAQPFVNTVVGRSRPVIIALTLAITLLLVIACINIANLMLVRLLGRSRDIAVRQALGANPGHIARLSKHPTSILSIQNSDNLVDVRRLFLSSVRQDSLPVIPYYSGVTPIARPVR